MDETIWSLTSLQTGVRPAGDRAEDACNLVGAACAAFQRFHAEGGRQARDGIHNLLQFIRIAKHRDARHMRCNLIERLQPFASDRRLEIRETREVAARSAEVGDNAGALGIGDSDKYGWNRFRSLPHRGQDRCACDKNDFRRRGDERGSVSSEAVCNAGNMIIDMNVTAFDANAAHRRMSSAWANPYCPSARAPT